MSNYLPIQGEHLKRLRKRKGYTQEIVAEKLGVTTKTYRNWERAETSPASRDLIALSDLYGVSTDFLLGLIEEKNRDEKFVLEYTGLSEKAVDHLKSLDIATINLVLCSDHFEKILLAISNSAKFSVYQGNLVAEYVLSKLRGDNRTAALLNPLVTKGVTIDDAFRASIDSEVNLLFDEVSSALYDLNETTERK